MLPHTQAQVQLGMLGQWEESSEPLRVCACVYRLYRVPATRRDCLWPVWGTAEVYDWGTAEVYD
jgi:hypothetical protein